MVKRGQNVHACLTANSLFHSWYMQARSRTRNNITQCNSTTLQATIETLHPPQPNHPLLDRENWQRLVKTSFGLGLIRSWLVAVREAVAVTRSPLFGNLLVVRGTLGNSRERRLRAAKELRWFYDAGLFPSGHRETQRLRDFMLIIFGALATKFARKQRPVSQTPHVAWLHRFAVSALKPFAVQDYREVWLKHAPSTYRL